MCGIIGIIGNNEVTPLLIEGLRRLEYRGYDSAGIATLENGKLRSLRAEGKLKALEKELQKHPLSGTIGIGHTRWATHGAPTTINAHPHITDKVAVIHNGIIENFIELRTEMQNFGYSFQSQTDTEVIPVLLTHYLNQGKTPHEAVKLALKRLEGAFAIGILFAGNDNLLIAARRGSPLAIGYGDGEMYLASDAYVLAPLTSKITYLDEGDWAEITRESVTIYDFNNNKVERPIKITSISGASIGKGDYRHYMLKEIYEQPSLIGQTLNSFYNPVKEVFQLPKMPFSFEDITKITIVACGTSYYAGLTAKYWLEGIAKIPTEVDIASEFRYANKVLPNKGLAIFISQSGETADTLAAIELAKSKGATIIGICNVVGSSIARATHAGSYTHAGPEIGVASTKAFTAQVTVLTLMALRIAFMKGTISSSRFHQLLSELEAIPEKIEKVLLKNNKIKQIAEVYKDSTNALYLGRGYTFPVALEGALKLKEISYIHAEGYPAAEMKHGPIALIDQEMPVFVIATKGASYEKVVSNIQEVKARKGKIIAIVTEGDTQVKEMADYTIQIPETDEILVPLVSVVPLQLLSYHIAVMRGCNVDQPRNLAKSVTVE